MPTIYKTVARYYDQSSGMSWLHTNFRYEETPEANAVAFTDWQEAYMAACSAFVYLLDFRVYTELAERVVRVVPGVSITPHQGTTLGAATEISSYAQWRGQGGIGAGGSSAWKLHGLSEEYVEGSKLKVAAPEIGALLDAGLAWFRQYRPVAGASVPVVSPPAEFETRNIDGMFTRRTGRSFLSIGQQRRYTRTPAAS